MFDSWCRHQFEAPVFRGFFIANGLFRKNARTFKYYVGSNVGFSVFADGSSYRSRYECVSHIFCIYYTVAAIVLYCGSNWILGQIEKARGKPFGSQRSLVFLLNIMTLAYRPATIAPILVPAI